MEPCGTGVLIFQDLRLVSDSDGRLPFQLTATLLLAGLRSFLPQQQHLLELCEFMIGIVARGQSEAHQLKANK